MFNMQRIGKKISQLRKSKNMTQMELADKLGISFQAVSNWERGISMPDITNLPELADILEVYVDELLGENSAIVEAAINNRIDEVIADESVTMKDINEALPILKPNQVDTIIKQVDKSDSETLVMFLPYMKDDDVRDLAIETYKNGESIEIYLPFMSEDDVRDMAIDAYKKGKSIEIYLPFMFEDDVRDMAIDAYKKGESIEIYLPFMSEDDISDLAFETYKNGKTVDMFLPFMCEDDVGKLALNKAN